MVEPTPLQQKQLHIRLLSKDIFIYFHKLLFRTCMNDQTLRNQFLNNVRSRTPVSQYLFVNALLY